MKKLLRPFNISFHTCYLSLFIVCSLMVFPVRAEIIDRIIAKVGTDVVTLSEVEEIAKQSEINLTDDIKTKIINSIIDRLLLVQDARKEKIDVPDGRINAAVENEINRIRQTFTSEPEYKQWLFQQNMTPEEIRLRLKQRVTQEILISQLLRKKTPPVSSIQIQDFSKNNPDEAQKQVKVRIRHIFFSLSSTTTVEEINKVQEKAMQVYHELKAGGTFERLVIDNSDDVATKEIGGDLGYIGHGETLPEIEKVAFELDTNQISEPIRSENGIHIIQVMDKASAREFLYQQAMQKTQDELIKTLRERAQITIKL
jgi:parvulin-like peptidyl-prolyl isomerase